MCFAVGPERFVPRCGCSVTLLERREDGLGSFPVDSFPRRGARCSYFSTAPPPGRPFSFCAANSYALLVESRPPDRFAPLFVRPIRASASYEAHGHIGMTIAPAGIAAVRKSFLDLMAPATG
jgi:hypothetical protein